jgi:alanine dehydrogenase
LRILRHEALASLLGWPEAIAAIRQGLEEQRDRQLIQPRRITFDSGNGWLRLMPASLPRLGVMGYKAMHLTRGAGVRYVTHLYELASGALLAVMDADWLTALRTAATSAVAIDCLAPADLDQVGIIGSGVQARAHLAALVTVRRPRRVVVYSRDRGRREAFARAAEAQHQLPVRAVENPRAAVAGSALVVVAIQAGSEPVLEADWLEPGTQVVGISSVQPTAREIADAVWRRAALVVADDRDHVLESGDGQSALRAGAISPEAIVELWEVAAGNRMGRPGAGAITLFKSVGAAWQDLVVAWAAYRAAVAAGVGEDIGTFPGARLPTGALANER